MKVKLIVEIDLPFENGPEEKDQQRKLLEMDLIDIGYNPQRLSVKIAPEEEHGCC